jgi:hypothetical protein
LPIAIQLLELRFYFFTLFLLYLVIKVVVFSFFEILFVDFNLFFSNFLITTCVYFFCISKSIGADDRRSHSWRRTTIPLTGICSEQGMRLYDPTLFSYIDAFTI